MDITETNDDGTETTRRFYKVKLGRDADNTWFQTHPIYNEAGVGRFALKKVSSENENTKIAAVFSVEKYDTNTKMFAPYADYLQISTDTTSAYTYSNFLEPGLYRLKEDLCNR